MSTANEASGTSDSTQEPENEQPHLTLKDIRPRFDCEIRIIGSVKVDKGMRIDGEGYLRTDENFGKPDWYSLDVEKYRCTSCDTTFEEEAEARTHLERQYQHWKSLYTLPGIPGEPTNAPGQMPSFGEEEEFTISGLRVVGRKDKMNQLALVTTGVGGVLATARREYSLPSNYGFDSWEPFNDGALTFPNGAARISENLLASAIQFLSQSNGVNYDPEKFTLYERGDAPFFLVAHGKAIAIAPRTASSPTEK